MSEADAVSLALSTAWESVRGNNLPKAEQLCTEILAANPNNARAWHLQGVIHAQRTELERAATCFENATKHRGDNAVYHYNLGLARSELRQLEQAVAAYRAAIANKPDFLEARNNLGNALLELGNNEEALDCFRELVKDFPQSGDSHYNLGNVLQDIGEADEAIAEYRRTLELDASHASARENLGRAFVDDGRIEEARQVWASWLEREPSNAVARHMLASLSGENVPERCDDGYVRETFDETFAKSFDRQLARIQYQAPELVGEAFKSIEADLNELDVLDAGCGTGLCGPIFRPHARQMVGVDLSEDMLVEARKRETYDETVACELTEYMKSHAQSFDLIISADTFCYFGNLREVLGAAFNCLRTRGTLIMTVESASNEADEKPFQLQPNGRYRHTESYVTTTLQEAGFSIAKTTHAVLRQESGFAVDGLVITATK